MFVTFFMTEPVPQQIGRYLVEHRPVPDNIPKTGSPARFSDRDAYPRSVQVAHETITMPVYNRTSQGMK